MILYAKIVNPVTKECNVGVGNNEEFYKSLGMEKMDVEQSYKGGWFLKGYAPIKTKSEENQEKIIELEARITERNIRSALLGDSYAKHKIEVIEAQIAELRKQLEGGAQ